MAKSRLGAVSTDVLQQELRRRQRRLPTLRAKQQKLQQQLRDVEQEIAELAAATAGGRRRGAKPGRKRPKNDKPLADMLATVLKKNRPMKVSNIVVAVKKAGYKTYAENFSTIVNQTLIKDKRFKSAKRGHYVLA